MVETSERHADLLHWNILGTLLKAQPICVLESGAPSSGQEIKDGYPYVLLCDVGLIVFISEGYDDKD